MNIEINPVNIYSSEDKLFVTDGDHNLIEIAGEQVGIVEKIISEIKGSLDLEATYEKVAEALDHDRDFYNEIIEWLVDNGIATRNEVSEKKEVSVSFQGLHGTESIEKAIELLNSGQEVSYSLAELPESAELTLVFSPIYDQYHEVLALNKWAYQTGTDILHVGLDRSSFTLGPLVVPKLKTPCLQCYSKRKLSNMKNPSATLNFTKHAGKRSLHNVVAQDNPNFGTLLAYVRKELATYYKSGKLYSNLMAKSVFFDSSLYEVSKSKILRLPNCPVCAQTNHQSVLNL